MDVYIKIRINQISQWQQLCCDRVFVLKILIKEIWECIFYPARKAKPKHFRELRKKLRMCL